MNVCAGVASQIYQPCDPIEEDSKKVYEMVTSVDIGIRLCHDLITQVSWQLPSDALLNCSRTR